MSGFASISSSVLRSVLRSIFRTVTLIPISIFLAKVLEVRGILVLTDDGETFVWNFIEWFGVLYGILLPLILVRVWEQLDKIDREFDREADAVKLLYEDIYYLPGNSAKFALETAGLLRSYVDHIIEKYRYEIKPDHKLKGVENRRADNNIFLHFMQILFEIFQTIKSAVIDFLYPNYQNIDPETIRADGDNFLQDIRKKYKDLIFSYRASSKEPDPFIEEIFRKLNDIVDIRGDRISLASQRLFESLRFVALIASIIFLLPFYFVSFQAGTPPFIDFLTGSVTLLVIFIYLVIEDFDEPFGGTWRITDDSWKRVLNYMDIYDQELENLGEQHVVIREPRRWSHNRSERLKRHSRLRLWPAMLHVELSEGITDIQQTKKPIPKDEVVRSQSKRGTSEKKIPSKSKAKPTRNSSSSKQTQSRKTRSS